MYMYMYARMYRALFRVAYIQMQPVATTCMWLSCRCDVSQSGRAVCLQQPNLGGQASDNPPPNKVRRVAPSTTSGEHSDYQVHVHGHVRRIRLHTQHVHVLKYSRDCVSNSSANTFCICDQAHVRISSCRYQLRSTSVPLDQKLTVYCTCICSTFLYSVHATFRCLLLMQYIFCTCYI